MATDGVDDLLGELRAGGELDSQGRFTLDRAQARAKMQKFQLGDARRYVLELVQAAVLRGATTVRFDIDADDMHMAFDGQAFAAEELDDVWGSIFADGDAAPLRGLRQLALGLNAALGLGPRRIVVRSGDCELRLTPGREDVLTREMARIEGTKIHVAQRIKLAVIVGFFKNIGGTLAEEVHLKQRCGHSTVAITLDGAAIARGLTIAEVEHTFAVGGIRGVVGVTMRDDPAELRLIKDGVWIDTHPLDQVGPGIVAVVEGEALRKDVSLAKIVADEALGRVIGVVRGERWGALARLVESLARSASLPPAIAERIRHEALQHLRARDVRDRPDAAIVAGALTWPDARTRAAGRTGPGTVTLLELTRQVVTEEGGTRSLRVATGTYDDLVAEAPAIPLVEEHERKGLAKVLGCRLVVVDEELRRANTRARAHREWLKRTTDARLPLHGRALGRGTIAGPEIRGEVGINDIAEGSTYLIREGRLLAARPLKWGIDGFEAAVEAMFEPTDDYLDVARDATFVAAMLAVLAAVGPAIGEAAEKSRGTGAAAAVRKAAVAWLLLALDEKIRAGLWARLGVAESLQPDEAAVRAVVPGPGEIGRAAPWVMRVQLFEAFDGSRRSLADLAWRREHAGHIDYVDATVAREPGLGTHVVRLSHDEWRVVWAMFGVDAVRNWAPELQRTLRERAFRARPPEDAAAKVRDKLRAWGLDPAVWGRTIDEEGVTGAIGLACTGAVPNEEEALRTGTIEVLVEGRALTTRTMALGIGPIVGVVGSPGLTANAAWDDVADDEALATVTRVVAATAWSLVLALLQRDAGPGRWVTRMMLRRLALADREAVEREHPEALTLELRTISGGTVTLATVLATVQREGQVAWVSPATATAALADPPVLREETAVLEALLGIVGKDRLVNGAGRLLEQQRGAWLLGLPVVEKIKLEPGRVWAVASIGGGTPKLAGEIGLSRTRTDGGLALELCTQGRRVGVVRDPGFEVACEAIVSDAELPLTADVQVDTRTKRYGQYLRRCRKAAFGLVAGLCERFEELAGEERAAARGLLLAFAATERQGENARSGARQVAWDAVRAAPLLTDAWGAARTLLEVEAHARAQGAVEVVRAEVTAPAEAAALGRMIVRVDAAAEAALTGIGPLRALDERWADEVAALQVMARAPAATLPDLAKEAWIDRKATIAGGLQAHLWVRRRPSEADAIVFTRGGREVGRVQLLPGLACAGLVSGEGLVVRGSGVELDERQRTSLGKQVCLLLASLAGQVKAGGGRMSREERERARAWLLAVEGALAQDGGAMAGLGKPLQQTREAMAGLVSPSLRKQRDRAEQEKRAEREKRAEEAAVAAAREKEAAEAERAAERAEAERFFAEEEAPAVRPTPEQALIAAVRAELEWVRARHGTLLERLRLDRLAIGTGPQPGIAIFERGLVLQRRHPLIARQLARLAEDQPVDPIDLMFIVSAVYTVMNAAAEEIDADDEQAFVARMAENLAAGLGR